MCIYVFLIYDYGEIRNLLLFKELLFLKGEKSIYWCQTQAKDDRAGCAMLGGAAPGKID